VSSSLTDEDFVALLIGEASGNYNPATHPRGTVAGGQMSDAGEVGNAAGKPITMSAGPVVAALEKEITVPVSVAGVTGKEIISYEFNVRYDPAVVQPVSEPVDVRGTVSRGLMVVANPYEPGLLRVVVYGAMPIDADGEHLDVALGKLALHLRRGHFCPGAQHQQRQAPIRSESLLRMPRMARPRRTRA